MFGEEVMEATVAECVLLRRRRIFTMRQNVFAH